MAIIQQKPIVKKPLTDHFKPLVESKERKSVIVDNKEIPTNHLLSHVRGYHITVDYYHQAINEDSRVKPEDIGDGVLFQQYRKIKNFEFKISSPNSADQNDEDKVFTVRGSGIIHNGIIPNEGDMFAMDVGDGRIGYYNITQSLRLSVMKESVYQIEYSLSFFNNQSPERVEALETKVLETYHYVRDYLLYNKKPLLVDNEYQILLKLKKKYKEIYDNYFRWFFSNEYRCFLLPGQSVSILDYYINELIKVLATKETDNFNLQWMQSINIEDDNYLRYPQLFDALKYRDLSYLKIGYKYMGITSTSHFQRDPMMENIRYTGIKYIVYPDSRRTHDDDKYNGLVKGFTNDLIQKTYGLHDKDTPLVVPMELILTPHVINNNTNLPPPKKVEPKYQYPLIKEVKFDGSLVKYIHNVDFTDTYVFSKQFYESMIEDREVKDLSLLELLTIKYLKQQNYPIYTLELLVDDYYNWSKLNQFYYLPILMILMQSHLMEL